MESMMTLWQGYKFPIMVMNDKQQQSFSSAKQDITILVLSLRACFFRFIYVINRFLECLKVKSWIESEIKIHK